MIMPVREPLLEIEQNGDVTLAKLTSRKILDEETTVLIGNQLLSLVKVQGCRKLILNFATVERLASVMLGKLVALNRQITAVGGRLALCQITPPVFEIFEILKLDQLLNIYEDEQQALASF